MESPSENAGDPESRVTSEPLSMDSPILRSSGVRNKGGERTWERRGINHLNKINVAETQHFCNIGGFGSPHRESSKRRWFWPPWKSHVSLGEIVGKASIFTVKGGQSGHPSMEMKQVSHWRSILENHTINSQTLVKVKTFHRRRCRELYVTEKCLMSLGMSYKYNVLILKTLFLEGMWTAWQDSTESGIFLKHCRALCCQDHYIIFL